MAVVASLCGRQLKLNITTCSGGPKPADRQGT